MLDSLYIQNFKCLKNLKIQPLGRVNLLIGQNNVGKSTILEAISIFASNMSAERLFNVLDLRGEKLSALYPDEKILVEDEVKTFLPLVTNQSLSLLMKEGITIGSSEQQFKINVCYVRRKKISSGYAIQLIPSDSEDVKDAELTLCLYEIKHDKQEFRQRLFTFDGGGLRDNSVNSRVINVEYPCSFISTRDKASNTLLNKAWSVISMKEEENYLIDALRIIEPHIMRFNMLSDGKENKPFVTIQGRDGLIRLSSMGDGINKILSIILTLLNCKNGTLLIDEIENGLHYTALFQLWKMILHLAEALNVQVFATTHSSDCIKSFVESDEKHIGKVIRLENRDGDVIPIVFDNLERLNFSIQQNIDIR
jgi:AAA15 family ATPase/GTPase